MDKMIDVCNVSLDDYGGTVLNLPVIGAGALQFEYKTGNNHRCGGANGIGVSVSWGDHPYIGGVMDRRDVKNMIDQLTRWYDSTENIQLD